MLVPRILGMVVAALIGFPTARPARIDQTVVDGPPAPGPEIGLASWYGPGFHGRLTARGDVFDRFGLTCAHRTLPLGTIVRVEVVETGVWIELPVTDRGPYVDGRVVDLSEQAALDLGIYERGIAKVRVIPVG